MKFSLALVATAAAVLVSAQDLSQLPDCSKQCAGTAMAAASTCKATDIKCICNDKAFMTTIGPCVKTSCDAADQKKTIQFAVALCKNAGVDIPQSEIDYLTKSAEPSSSATSHHSTKAGTYASATPSSEPTSTSTHSASSSSVPSGAANKLGVSGLGLGAAAAALFLL